MEAGDGGVRGNVGAVIGRERMGADLGAAAPSDPAWPRMAPAIFLLFWSAGFAVAKIGLGHAQPMTFLSLRYGLVLAVLAPLVIVLRPPPPPDAAAWVHLAIVGVLIQVVYFGLTYVAVDHGVSAGGVALIVSLQPVLVAMLAPTLIGERIGGRRWLGFALGLAGAGLVIVSRSAVEATSAVGLLAASGALAGMTAATFYEKRFGGGQHPVTANAVQYAAGLAGTLPLAWWLEDGGVRWSAGFAVALGYLVIANSLIALTLLLAMVRRGEVARVSALFFLVPPAAALIAWVLLGEAMPPLAWLGLGVAAVGVALAGRATG